MKTFAALDMDEYNGAIAEPEIPWDVNPNDPDDEVRYFTYVAWRDELDYFAKLEADYNAGIDYEDQILNDAVEDPIDLNVFP